MTAPDTQSPAPADKPRREPMFTPEDKANIAWFWRGYLREKLPWLIVVFGMVIAQGFVYQQFLRLTESGLRVIFDSGTLRDLVVICAAVFGVFAFRGVMSYLIPRVSVWIAADAVAKLRRELIHHLMELDLAFFEHTPPAAMIQKLVGQVEGLGNFVGQTTVKAGRDIATVVIVSIYLAYQQPLLFASAAIVFPVIILTMQLVSRKVKLVQAQTENAMRDYISTIDETMSGMRTVKIAGQEEVEEDRLVKSTSRLRRLTIRRNAAQAVILPCIDFAAAFVYMLVIGGGGYMVISPAFDVDGAAIIAFLIGLVLIFDPGRRIAQFVVSLQGALVQLRLVRGLYDERAGIVDAPDAVSEFDTGADLTLDNVTFGYEPDRPLFRDLSLTFGGGQVTAIVGPTGSGKTTILSLLGRLYDPIGGTVRIGDIPVNKIRISDLRQAFSVVAQDIVIFNSSILDNIRYVNPDATDAEVRAAAEAAELADVIAERGDLPVGPKGAQLSGGQKQRIAIARAMIRDPKVLLLDEATSALDTESERVVMEALDAIVAEGRRTTLVIAHRLSTVKNSDVIFVLEDGSLVERGTHAELLATEGGLYQQLVQLQNLSGDGEQEPPLEQLTRQLSRQTSRRQSESALSRQSSELSRQHSGLSRQESSPLGRLGSALSRERSSRELRRAVSGSLARAASEFAPTSQAAYVEERGGGAEDTSRDAVPGEDEQDKEVPSSRLLGLLSTGWLAVAMVMTGFQSCCGPLMGRLFGHSIDVLSAPPALPLGPGGSWVPAYSAAKVHDAVRETCVLYGAVSAVQLVSIYLAGSGFRRVSEGLTRRVRIETFSAIMRQEMAYFDLRTCGQLTDRLAHEAAMIKSFTGESFGGVVRVLVTIVVAMCLALLESWQLTATLILIMPFMMVGQIFKMRSLKKKDESRAGPVVSEVVGNIKTVAAFSLQDRMLKWYKDVLRKEFMEDKRQCTVTAIMEGYNSFVTYMLYGSVMLVASCYIDFFHLDPQSVLQVFFTLVFSLGGISQGITQWQGDKAKGAHALKRIFNTLDRTPRIDAYDEGGLRLEKVEGAIGFSHVHFSYPSQPHVKVFVDFDLAIEAGKRVAFVGPSGSGKSTTIRLLQRFYDPAAGCVTFDGHDIRSLNLQWLRSVMSLVQQEPVLFAGSVLDNIKYGREGATDDDAIAAAKDANAHDFITKFEDQYQTSVGERGAQLSGGQKQRVAIARCMVRRPRVLLLDEATSALDTESERVVQEALDALLDKEQRTTLVIAHRLSTVQSCDAICVVYQGRVVEKGTHQELMRIPGGQYKQLAARQQL